VILVDTSIWVDHLRSANAVLVTELEAGNVLTHPLVVGELACGNLKNRREVLGLLAELPAADEVTHAEALSFLEARALMGRGVGFADVHLLASAALGENTLLWTRDKRLASIAGELGLGSS
jgi:predicted nucleic acid-binding protein